MRIKRLGLMILGLALAKSRAFLTFWSGKLRSRHNSAMETSSVLSEVVVVITGLVADDSKASRLAAKVVVVLVVLVVT